MVSTLDKGQITPWIVNLGKLNFPYTAIALRRRSSSKIAELKATVRSR
jgi:hypothetical protein